VFDLEINDPYSFFKNLKISMFSKFDKVIGSTNEIHLGGLRNEVNRWSMFIFGHLGSKRKSTVKIQC
jgi:hypothetical protein